MNADQARGQVADAGLDRSVVHQIEGSAKPKNTPTTWSREVLSTQIHGGF